MIAPNPRALAKCCLLAAPALGGCAKATAPEKVQSPADARASSARPHSGKHNPYSDCYMRFRPTGNPRGDLARITRACGRVGGMRPVTRVRTDHQSERDPADRFTFHVPNAGSCYRVYATGDRNIGDLDLLLRGPDGEDLVADLTHDAWPVLPPRAPLCFSQPGLYVLEVSVFRGAGSYAVQIWGR